MSVTKSNKSMVIGEVSETQSEVEVQWRIPDFFTLSDKVDDCYISPTFYFAGTSWYVQIHPNGETTRDSSGHIGIFLVRGDSGPAISVKYHLKVVGSKENKEFSSTADFTTKGCGWGISKIMVRSNLLERKSEFAPGDVVTIRCSLKHDGLRDLETSLCRRLHNVSNNLKEIYVNSHRNDVVLNVDGEQIPAHKMILESRSPVFSAMFSHDMKENRTGEVDIRDIDLKSFGCVLSFMYCGEIDWLSTENACSIYSAAEKYDLPELKKLALVFIRENLSPDWVCDVIKFADLYREEEIGETARKFFKENAAKVLETDHWKTFSMENHEIAMDLVVTAFKETSLK